MNEPELAAVLRSMGCPAAQCSEMARQLEKRARQLAAERRMTEDQALAHLLGLMRQGWAARERGA
jgi:hypothetical protein